MEYGAIDLHLRRSVIRIEDETGSLIQQGRMATTRADLARIFSGRPPMRVLLESSTDSEWVAVLLESFGHELIVADPSYLPMYGERQRRVKTDQRDVRALVTACRHGHYRRAHRVSATTRALRQELRVRRHLVQMRTQTINVLRALLRQEGLRLPSGAGACAVPSANLAGHAADPSRPSRCERDRHGDGGSGGPVADERARCRPGHRVDVSCGARHTGALWQ